MSSRVDAVVFDLDDTICSYRRHGSDVLASAFDRVGVEPCFEIEDYYAIADDYVGESDSGPENRERCFAVLAERAGLEPAIGQEIARAYATERDHGNVSWVPGAEDVLESFEEDYQLGLLSNGDRQWQIQKLRALGIEDRFDALVYAGYDLPAKPDPAPFEVVLDDLDVEPAHAVTVGDSLRLDVKGAHNAGMGSVWLDPAGDEVPEIQPDYRIESMRELLAEPWD